MEGKNFYISDLHLYEKKFLDKQRPNRRDFPDIDTLHKMIGVNWKNKVKMQDSVYILGDVGSPRHCLEIIRFMKKLPGKKILITGNHDLKNLEHGVFRSVFSEIHIYQRIKDKGRDVVLFHYPIEEWERYWAGAYHIHGHTHLSEGHIEFLERRYNASVEENGYTPMTLDELIEKRKGGLQ